MGFGCSHPQVAPTVAPLETLNQPTFVESASQFTLSLDEERRTRAATLEKSSEPVSTGTFAAICKPVGLRMKKEATERGWRAQQLAKKYRNPANEADKLALGAIERFEKEPALQEFSTTVFTSKGKAIRYFRRIMVDSVCLKCHGSANSRPEFIRKEYPHDLAHSFRVGDVRGVYSVTSAVIN